MPFNRLTGAVILALSSQAVYASGFALIEQSASGQGLSYAGAAANAEDASVMWFNPAGLTQIEASQAILGAHVIAPSAKFTNASSAGVVGGDGSIAGAVTGLISGAGDDGATLGFVPNVYWKTELDGVDFGLGINVPFGQHISYDETWVGRYHATETDLKTLNINPSIAKKVSDKLSFGFGLNVQYVDVLLGQKINQKVAGAAVADGNAEVTGNSWAFGYNLGLMYQPSESLNLGVGYRSAITHDVNGQVKYSNMDNTTPIQALGGATFAQVFTDAAAAASVSLPDSLTVAADYKLSDKVQLLASATWTGWKAYDELVVDFANAAPDSESNQSFQDSMRYSLGMSYQYSSKWKLRTGLAFDETPVPNAQSRSPRTPDSDRAWLSFGAGYSISKNVDLDVGYTHIYADKAPVNYNISNNLLDGEFNSSVDILSAQLVWNY